GAIGAAESLFRYKLQRSFGNFQSLSLPFHLSSQFLQVELRDLPHLIHSQGRENNYLINTIAKLRREALLCRFHHFVLNCTKVSSGLCAKAKRFLEFLEAVRPEVRRHNNYGVGKIHSLPPTVSQPPFVKCLKEQVHKIGRSFFNFIQ